MPSPSRQSRRDPRRAAAPSAARSRWLLPLLGGGVVVVAGVLAIVLSGMGAGGPSSTLPPSTGAVGSVAPSSAPAIDGVPLADFENPNDDPAIGRPAPAVRGGSFDGTPSGIVADGRPKVAIFLAHWCPHCQAEVALLQAWVDSGDVPEGVDLVSVVTSIDPSRPNYPPDAWLEREGWTIPVIVDPGGSVASAYGLTAFPFWTFIGGDGTVRGRAVGERSIADLEAAIAGLTGG